MQRMTADGALCLYDAMSVRGLSFHLYKWLEPTDKKALSETCRLFRKLYLQDFFPRGLRPVVMQLDAKNLAPFDDRGGGRGEKREAMETCVCGRPASPSIHVLGFKAPGLIGMLTHCGKTHCRERVVKESFEIALRCILLDEGNDVYIDRPSYHSIMSRCSMDRLHAKYGAMKTMHDTIVHGMLKHRMNNGSGGCDDRAIPLHDILGNYFVTFDDLVSGGKAKKQIIYASLKPEDMEDIQMSQGSAPLSLTTAAAPVVNVFADRFAVPPAPAWAFAVPQQPIVSYNNGQRRQQQQPPTFVDNNNNSMEQPVPMEY